MDNRLLRALPFFIGGVALGAVIGVLFAPRPGRETRQELRAWLKQKREESRRLASKVREAIPAKKDQVVAAFRAGKEALESRIHKEPVHA